MQKLTLISILTITLLGLDLLTAAEVDSVKYRFNPIVVTATKVQGAQREIAASVSVIDDSEIQHSLASTALDLVKDYVPGIFITERSVMGYGVANGAAGGISIRGIGGSPVTGVLVLRDGRPDIMGMMGHPIPDAYSLDGLERIEILRGPASFLYGSNAMGGVINLVSKKMEHDGFSTKISAGAGEFKSQKVNLNHGGRIGAFDYFVTAATKRTDGHRENSDYRGSFYTTHFGYQLNKNLDFAFNANYSDIHLLDPGTITNPFFDNWYNIRRSGADLSINHSGFLGQSHFKIHSNFGRHEIFDGWRSNDRTVGIMFFHNVNLWTGNTTTVGFDYKNYGGNADDSINKSPVINYDAHYMTEYAPYVHLQQIVLKNFIISAGLRHENHQLYGSETLPKIGLVSQITSFTSLRISAAKGFRSPSIRELYVFPPRNEKLQPERMWNYEAGLTQQLGKKAEMEAVLFRSEGSNMIRTLGLPPNMQFTNSGDFTHDGYELLLRWYPIENLNISSSWSDMNLGDETRETPEKKLTLNMVYDFGKIDVLLNLLHAAQLYGADSRQEKLPNYTLLNVAVDVRPWKATRLRIMLKNALEEEYQIISGYPMPKRHFMTELAYSF